jgi:HSP20 family protein
MELWLENGLNRNGLWRGALDLLRESERGETHFAPPVEIVEDRDSYHFHLEMPGLKNDSINVRVEDGTLIVEAERKRPEWPKDAEVHRAERRYGLLRRGFRLPEEASPEQISAHYRDGVLEVTVGKRPEAKPVKVKVEYQN